MPIYIRFWEWVFKQHTLFNNKVQKRVVEPLGLLNNKVKLNWSHVCVNRSSFIWISGIMVSATGCHAQNFVTDK